MSNCKGCGAVLDPTQDEINQAVDEVLLASIEDAKKHGEICPLCGHSQAQPISHHKSVQFGLLVAILLVVAAMGSTYYMHRATERNAAAQEALNLLAQNPRIIQLLGKPLSVQGKILGGVKQDETGWHELKLTIPVHGPKGDGILRLSGGRETGPWKFTTLELVMPQLKQKTDLITGTSVEYSPEAYAITHTQAASVPEYVLAETPPARWNGDFPCVYAIAGPASVPTIGSCVMPAPMSQASRSSVDRFETDLRRGKFILRQTDLRISEADLDIPLTRTYTAQDWTQNNSHAFGKNGNHPYDIAPLGTRNPYTEQFLVLADGDFLYFPRVSKGTGYSDAIYRQSEVGNSFYKAVQSWDGNGWLTQLQDGSTIRFPESYNAKNLAQGAATEMTDSAGRKLELIRDAKRNLQEIRGPGGASIRLFYDGDDRIVRAEDGHGRWATYAYDSSGYLRDVVNSDGTARYYWYEQGLLTFVRDEQGRLLLRNSYNRDWVIQQQFGTGETIQLHYDLSPNEFYATKVTLTLPDDSIREVPIGDTISDFNKRMR